MDVFEITIALLLAGAGLTALSRRIGTPHPAMVDRLQQVEQELDFEELDLQHLALGDGSGRTS
jgi:hypothetical protein